MANCPRCGRAVTLVMSGEQVVYNEHQIALMSGAPRCPNSMQPVRR
jgi:hypothetical protein